MCVYTRYKGVVVLCFFFARNCRVFVHAPAKLRSKASRMVAARVYNNRGVRRELLRGVDIQFFHAAVIR